MPQPTTRVLALLELLQARPGLRGAELADRLAVDERTVRRYVAALVELGIPVRADRGRYGGYRLHPGFKLPPLMLTDDEAVAVVLGLQVAERLGVATGPARESALAKIERVLPVPLRDRVQALRDALDFTTPARAPTPAQAAHLLALGEAASRGHRVRVAYRSWRGTPSERDVDPYGLVFHSGRWYLSGLDQASGEPRTFRLDRIASVEPTPGRFTPPDDFDPVGHVTASLAQVPFTHEVEVVLDAPLAGVRRRVPPAVAWLDGSDGAVVLYARAERLDGMAQMLAGLGWPFTIRRPDALRAAVRALADRLAAAAG